ncbi:MAG: hypothetical protein FGF48_06455 [Candidatus Brockarchaeota archaeon]|nr:hypothetical protein [Candidatus Brockarchaeota archaeon]
MARVILNEDRRASDRMVVNGLNVSVRVVEQREKPGCGGKLLERIRGSWGINV